MNVGRLVLLIAAVVVFPGSTPRRDVDTPFQRHLRADLLPLLLPATAHIPKQQISMAFYDGAGDRRSDTYTMTR